MSDNLDEPPFESRLRFLKGHYEMNAWPLDRYHSPVDKIIVLRDAAHRDGVIPEVTTYPMGIWLVYYLTNNQGHCVKCRFDDERKLLRELPLDFLSGIVSDFEHHSAEPESYFLYRYLKYYLAKRDSNLTLVDK